MTNPAYQNPPPPSSGLACHIAEAAAFAVSALVLAGTFVMQSQWYIWMGICLFGAIWTVAAAFGGVAIGRVCTVPLAAILLWVTMMFGFSCVTAGWTSSSGVWCLGGLGLMFWLLLLSQTATSPKRTEILGHGVVWAATISGAASVAYFGLVHSRWHSGMRLENWLVYGGWNQVCSGVTWAFAAVWAALLWSERRHNRWVYWMLIPAHVILIWVTFATLSRSAVLVLLAGHGALLLWHRRRAIAPLIQLLMTLALFHGITPQLSKRGDALIGPSKSHSYSRVIDANPLKEWSKRGDTGRFDIYHAVLAGYNRSRPLHLWLGHGLWCDEDAVWRLGLEGEPDHAHSVFLATLIHGGGIGLTTLLVVLVLGFKRAWQNAKAGGSAGGCVLGLSGLMAVLFDGQTLASIDSIPRFETLLVWAPLVLFGQCLRR